MRFASLAAVVALAVPFAFAAEDVREASSALRHADGGFQPSAHGGVGIRTGSDFERFTVAIEGLGELATVKVLLGDGHENFSEIGTLPAGSSNRKLELTTKEGGHLPYDAEHVADLSGRGVRVVDGESHLILVGEVPHFADVPDTPPPAPSEPVVTRSTLQRPDGTDFHESRGVVVASHGGNGDSLRVEIGRLAHDAGYLVYIGEGEGAAFFVEIHTNGDGGGSAGREAAAGQALTDRLPSLADLAGRRVEVRDGEQHVVLFGAVPGAETAHDAEPVHEEADHHDEASGADVHLVVELHPDKGDEVLRMRMSDLPRDGAAKAARRRTAEVYMDDGTGAMERVAAVRVSRRGRARLVWNTRRGDVLPLGAATLRRLSGRGFEVRVDGVRAVGGSLPIF